LLGFFSTNHYQIQIQDDTLNNERLNGARQRSDNTSRDAKLLAERYRSYVQQT